MRDQELSGTVDMWMRDCNAPLSQASMSDYGRIRVVDGIWGRAMKDLMKGTYGRRWSTDVDIVSYCQSTCVAQGQFPPGP